ncbi:capsular biosynthesis protein [Pseudoalteromonas sp. SG45-5]|uniref:Capsular biosynthesis protein n=1 Tax=Pseudoalteromonas aliena TaxID=247523 RepID=A0A1Q2H115_9GAMM|nr:MULTISPECIES: cellulose synthase operon protein YhjQ/BcsQ [Pseudoalteromonas]AQQ01053.1 capsular biosynthesis protein [Pseudoalteromonas aliena]MBB1385925.1 capsular biosynthesis protein [Pseudoalteromonas sp. SG45-5]MBB1393758.1 capsular biosynthesis protein [Pseudoalteromonas sp. SG44-4]MBB1446638.1 capsular biosynthesis protein [Pseudoalteromonas sp. SG41-6]TMO06145.1 capsular biosynthesis protein [Pseudoalteromonas sp. S558]
MKLIPKQYHELEVICNTMIDHNARCITFISLSGSEGSSSVCVSVAKRLQSQHKSVLIIDLNPINTFCLDDKLPTACNPWRFDDISCQLGVTNYEGISLLAIQNLAAIEPAKNKHVLNDAVARLKQEYDYILIDMSPALKLNRNNVPLHSLSICSELTFVTVALGINDEESLCKGIRELKQAGHGNIKILISQHNFAPLGERIVKLLEKHAVKWPKLSSRIKAKIIKQRWLFGHH